MLQLYRQLIALGPVTLLLDFAYLDDARDPQTVRDALDDYRAFGEEVGVLVGASLSLSKAYTLYGARALMSVLLRMTADSAAQSALAAEHAHWRTVLTERADALDTALKAEGLAGAPWDTGFFVTPATADSPATAQRLMHEGVCGVPSPEGLRVGICGLRATNAPRFAAAMHIALAD